MHGDERHDTPRQRVVLRARVRWRIDAGVKRSGIYSGIYPGIYPETPSNPSTGRPRWDQTGNWTEQAPTRCPNTSYGCRIRMSHMYTHF